MRIEELILDGFKSYPVRTSISGWDKSFNAITGLNGSGKSNILDAICFVLGITNLQAVRAQNLQDLIYKRGQAGITKASVTIVFDNSDRDKAPVGFENDKQVTVTRQVAMGGISKYLICGHRATQQAVQNLFQSVQLNINNPNFLIMQGKITKVLNMKPAEILGMIEEAAGTSMFEDKKDKATKTMAKKEKKMEEIQSLLKEEIEPKLNRLREEKRAFLEYQKAQSEFERLSRLVVAHEWTSLSSKHKKAAEQVEAKHDLIKEGKNITERIHKEIKRIEKEIVDITAKRDKEAKGGKIAALESQVKELAKELAKCRTQLELKTQTVNDDEQRVLDLVAFVRELATAKEQKSVLGTKASDKFAVVKNTCDTSTAALKQAEALLQTLVTGLSSSSSDAESVNSGYMGQIAQAKSRSSQASADAEQAKARVEHLIRELKQKEPRAKQAAKDDSGLVGELERARDAARKLEAELGTLDWDDSREDDIRRQREQASQEMRGLLERRDKVKSGLAGFDFDYQSPTRDFDRSKVKGLIATLIELDPKNHKFSTALEVCAGSRMYNVVVENEKVGSQLLENGKLTRRVTMIPLNQIQAFRASAEKLATANRVSAGTANLALSLVGYSSDVSRAMEYVFGGTLICPTAEAAQAVTFHKDIRLKSVTLDGDVYDPSGTLSGGSKPRTSGVLIRVQELQVIEKQLAEAKNTLNAIEEEWSRMKQHVERYKTAKRDLDLKNHEVKLLEQRVTESSASRIIAEVEDIKQQIVKLKDDIAKAKASQADFASECQRLEKEMHEFKNNRESKLEELRADITKRKAAVAKHTSEMKAMQKEVQTADLELEQMVKDISSAENDVGGARNAVEKGKADLHALDGTIKQVQQKHDATDDKLKEEMKTLSAFASELHELDEAKRRKETDLSNLEAEEKKLLHETERLAADSKKMQQTVAALEQKYTWITDDSSSFGKAGTQYDFSLHNMEQARTLRSELEQRQQGRAKKINPKVMVMIDQVEKQERELIKNHEQVVKDKKKIEDTIAKLDAFKLEALTKTHTKVSHDFGHIFAELLPGNFAKLVPLEGNATIMDGLEVKVQLGAVWKQSLTELSGGQRSLIALSLIMSLLQFKPAPMYILDEVDAALDLSHTQHIGQLFRTRFHGSQFIVVSLKEGLFTNANVLFRTRFREGTSICERTAQRTTNAATIDVYREQGLNQSGASRHAGRRPAVSAH